MATDCIFCRILNGEIPAAYVYRDEKFVAFLDIHPINKGHVLLVPRLHAEKLVDLPEDILAAELPVAARIARGVLSATGTTAFNLFNTNGAASGQEVYHHHLHIIPRRPDDGMKIKVSSKDYGRGEAVELAGRIAALVRQG